MKFEDFEKREVGDFIYKDILNDKRIDDIMLEEYIIPSTPMRNQLWNNITSSPKNSPKLESFKYIY